MRGDLTTSEARNRRSTLALLIAAGLPLGLLVAIAPQLLTDAFRSTGFMPHGHCYLWQPTLLAVHAISDLLIGFSYLAISLTLAYLVHCARSHIPFHWMVVAFGVFIVACGMTHFVEVVTLWTPVYWLAGDVKVITALASVGTALSLPPLIPRILELIRAKELADRRHSELAVSSEMLAREQAARNRAEEADRAKDQFLAMVSHELRTPLSPILGWSRMLQLGTLDADRQSVAIAAIERNATAQAQLIEDLLDVSRIVSGKLRLDVRPTIWKSVIEGAVEALRPSADVKQIAITLTLDPQPGLVLADPERLQQVVWNLLSNAIKFTPPHGRVEIRLERVGTDLELTLRDSGEGIAPALLPHVFERFWQADASTRRRHGGLGLGLAIVRHLIEAHGGEVSAHSEGEGHGSTFVIRLPAMSAAPESETHPASRSVDSRETATPLPQSLDGIRVLVVDDDPDVTEMVDSVLAAHGADVYVAGSARQALHLLDNIRVDVLLSDIGMPGEDGYSLIRQIRHRSPEGNGEVPAVALTAYARIDDRRKVLSAGFHRHVTKPVDPTELVTVVGSLVREVRTDQRN